MKLAAGALAVLFLTPVAVAARENGAELYATSCASCHGDRGQGSSLAPSLIGLPAVYVHFMLDTGRMPASIPNAGEIPRASRFSEEQIAQIVGYVLTLSPKRPDASLPLVMPGSVNRGRGLFAENCAQCHGAGGDGASVGAENVAPSLATATVFQVAEAIRSGPGVMPRFGPDVLSDRDVDDIARYVNFIQTQGNAPDGPDAGGFTLAHLGPVAEGFVAWFFGLGALALYVRFIGTAGKDA
ncbi:MAG TPA: c-type cytochrome [Candidatus Nitrosotalea sp.]|nr:c-type cytochrome [Candidatus Nitrosotalea sp.]